MTDIYVPVTQTALSVNMLRKWRTGAESM